MTSGMLHTQCQLTIHHGGEKKKEVEGKAEDGGGARVESSECGIKKKKKKKKKKKTHTMTWVLDIELGGDNRIGKGMLSKDTEEQGYRQPKEGKRRTRRVCRKRTLLAEITTTTTTNTTHWNTKLLEPYNDKRKERHPKNRLHGASWVREQRGK